MDGTLTNPAEGLVNCHRHALESVGLSVDDEMLRSLTGGALEEIYADVGVASDRVNEAVQLYRERFAIAGWLDDEPYPGIPELLERLTAAGWIVGVATMKLQRFAELVVDRVELGSVVSVVSGSDPTRARNTKRLIIEDAVGQLDFEPSGVAMVGDRHHDVTAARSLGFTAVGVTWGFGSIEELIGANASVIATTATEVGDFLLG